MISYRTFHKEMRSVLVLFTWGIEEIFNEAKAARIYRDISDYV